MGALRPGPAPHLRQHQGGPRELAHPRGLHRHPVHRRRRLLPPLRPLDARGGRPHLPAGGRGGALPRRRRAAAAPRPRPHHRGLHERARHVDEGARRPARPALAPDHPGPARGRTRDRDPRDRRPHGAGLALQVRHLGPEVQDRLPAGGRHPEGLHDRPRGAHPRAGRQQARAARRPFSPRRRRAT
jgi:hypothetical protein